MNKEKSILLIFALFAVVSIMIPFSAYADVVSPKKQTNAGITPQNVICKENLYKIILKSNDKPLCVKPSTAKKLMNDGLTKTKNIEAVEKFEELIKSRTAMGTITPITILKGNTNYHVLFEACAGDQGIIAPEVIITSDSETKYVKLVERMLPNSCETNSIKIKAANPDSINLNLVNKGGVTLKITELENKVKDLQTKLSTEKATLGTRVKDTQAIGEESSQRITQIAQMRAELNQAREELNRYLFALNLTPKIKTTDLEIKKSFAGTPLEGVLVNKLATSPQLGVNNGYDVAFEMCAGKQIVRIPVVEVKSDTETKKVRLADKIIAETCQVTGAKIMATSPDSIVVSIADTTQNSGTASDLEMQIADLTKQLQVQKQALRDLTHLAPRPDNFEQQALEISQKLIDLRNEINSKRVQLYNLLNQSK